MKKYKISRINMLFFVGIMFMFMMCTPSSVLSKETIEDESVDTLGISEVSMIKGELVTLKAYSLTRISLTNPEVADIVEANSDEILLIAKQEGQTSLFIWDEHGKRIIAVNVFSQHLGSIKGRLEDLFDEAGIYGLNVKINKKEGKVVVTGDIDSEQQENFDKIIAPFDRDLILLTKQENPEDLIQIDLQITELTTTLAQYLGVNWATSGDESIQLDFVENLPTDQGARVEDVMRVGSFNRTSALLATVQALITEGKARILSQPKLVVVSGEEASFLVGGEIPVRTTTVNTTGSAENIEYKEYGIGMTINPTIRKDKIDIILNTEISDIDGSSPAGADDVAFLTRSAQTQLYLNDNQTIVLAGLIKSNKSESRSRVPFFSKIPVVGLLFRNKTTPAANQDTEIVISLTPHILTDNKKDNDIKIDDIMKIEKTIISTDEAVEEKAVLNQSIEEAGATIKDTKDIKDALDIEEKAADTEEEVKSDIETAKKITEQQSSDDLSLKVSDVAPIDEAPYKEQDNIDVLEGIPADMQVYVLDIQKKIFDAISYPVEAEKYGWEGVVKLGMLILDDGTLAFALVKESSGYEVFDNNALKIAKKLAPYPKFPTNTDLMELSVTIPIVYSLKGDK